MKMPVDQKNIISILGIESLPDERKVQVVEKVADLVQKRLLVRILDSLDVKEYQEFTRVLDSNDSGRLEDFIVRNCPQMHEWLNEEISSVKQELSTLAPD
jgi:hypothetical protein